MAGSPLVMLRFPRFAGWLLAALVLATVLSGCNIHYPRGQALELENRWEEAAIEYHLAVLEDPDEEEYREALKRAEKMVARENFEIYKRFLAQKQFKKAYRRLLDASRQDPQLEPVKQEMKKWLRVLVAGQIRFEFRSFAANVSLADEIKLMARLNTPNPGDVIEAEINLDTGIFFVEDLLYDRPFQLLTYYSINAVGISLKFGRSRIRRFTSREFRRILNVRTPVVDNVEGSLSIAEANGLIPIAKHRGQIRETFPTGEYWAPRSIPHFSIRMRGQRVEVSTADGGSHFTPRFLYLNWKDRRLFVDFGRYKMKLDSNSRKWSIARMPLGKSDYFASFSRNIALRPYFFYREGVFTYAPREN
ncbi:MAG: hypothetical protein O7E56_13140 [SAR324 cluster bacterium]|nr:hypothetical protein [SAR324 cluster bacterium]